MKAKTIFSNQSNSGKMKIVTLLGYSKITMSEPKIEDTYFIEQSEENHKFYITSSNGYNGYEGDGYKEIEHAIKHVKYMIKMYFVDRSEENPIGW
jgi:hypothetical protein